MPLKKIAKLRKKNLNRHANIHPTALADKINLLQRTTGFLFTKSFYRKNSIKNTKKSVEVYQMNRILNTHTHTNTFL